MADNPSIHKIDLASIIIPASSLAVSVLLDVVTFIPNFSSLQVVLKTGDTYCAPPSSAGACNLNSTASNSSRPLPCRAARMPQIC